MAITERHNISNSWSWYDDSDISWTVIAFISQLVGSWNHRLVTAPLPTCLIYARCCCLLYLQVATCLTCKANAICDNVISTVPSKLRRTLFEANSLLESRVSLQVALYLSFLRWQAEGNLEFKLFSWGKLYFMRRLHLYKVRNSMQLLRNHKLWMSGSGRI